MKKLISAVLLVIAVGAMARLFWLNELAKDPSYSEMFVYLGIMIAAGLGFKAVQRGPLHSKPNRRSPERPKHSSPLDELAALAGTDDRADALAGWQLRLRSPFEPKRPVTSWIGGVPMAPPGFVWPRRDQGDALHLVAQIDLADLKAEPGSGQRPALPETGAMLIFITERVWSGEAERPSYHVIFLSADDMEHATAIPVPEDLRPLKDIGFWLQAPAFHYCPVDLVPFLDTDQRQAELPQKDGIDWIDTWGLAAFEAQAALSAMENERNQRKWRADYEKRRDKTVPLKKHQIRQREQDDILETSEKPVYDAVKAFWERAESQDPGASVDAEALRAVVALRQSLADRMPANTMMKSRMTPKARDVFSDLTLKYLDQLSGTLAFVPAAFHTFMTSQITARNHHRLFGLAIPAMTDLPDLRGVDCLLTFDSDPLLGNQTEHESGFSIWCDREEMAQGRFETGRVIWHTNV